MAGITRIESNTVGSSAALPVQQSTNSLIREVLKLIGQIGITLDRTSDFHNHRTEEPKKIFKMSTEKSADCIRKEGNAGVYSCAVSIALLGAGFLAADKSPTRELMKFLSSQTPQVTSMFTGAYRAEGKIEESKASISLQDYTAQSSKDKSNAELRKTLLDVLQAAFETRRKASQFGSG